MTDKGTKSMRSICFTLNNPTEGEETIIKNWSAVARGVYQHEIGKEQTPHLQGYLDFKYPLKFSTIKKVLDRAHIESRRGTAQQAFNYCIKEDTREEGKTPVYIGDVSLLMAGGKDKQKKTTLNEINDLIKQGKSIGDIYNYAPAFYVKNKKFILDMHDNYISQLAYEYKPKVVVVVTGLTGLGKTRYYMEEIGKKNPSNSYILTKSNQSLWLDGYTGQQNILIDEFYGWIPKHLFLQMTNGYPIKLEMKGGHTWFYPKLIYITSNKSPSDWYEWEDKDLTKGAFMRRITHLVEVTKDMSYEIFKAKMENILKLETFRPDMVVEIEDFKPVETPYEDLNDKLDKQTTVFVNRLLKK